MKIEIDLKEIFTEGDEESSESIQEALKTSIIYEVVGKIESEYKEQIDEQIRKIADERVKELFDEVYKKEFEKQLFETEIKESSYNNEPKVPFKVFIKNKIQSLCIGSYDNITEIINSVASKKAKEIRDKYDLLFASQIVNKISEQGLLKDEKLKELLK